MSIIDTLITDRTPADAALVRSLNATGWAAMTDEQRALYLSEGLKGAYKASDLNRVNAAMDYLVGRLKSRGINVELKRSKIPHKKPSGGVKLPEGHNQLKWIESTGTQYVDTLFKPNSNTKVSMEAEITSTASENQWLFGSRTPIYGVYYYSSAIGCGFNSNYYNGAIGQYKGRLRIEFGKTGLICNEQTYTFSASDFVSSVPITLLGRNDAGAVGVQASAKLYSCQIYDNDTLVRDFVPDMLDSGEVGLYDLVEGKFYGNSGTGSFYAGSIVKALPDGYTRVGHIESNGTQYIDTGVVGKTGIRAAGKFRPLSLESCILLGSYSPQRCYMLSFNGTNIRYGYVDWYTASTAVTAGTDYEFTVDFSAGSQYLRLNGTNYVTSTNSTTFTNSYPMYLFAYNDAGTAGDFGKCRIYGLQLYDGFALIRDFVPCANPEGELGLYDMVNGEFYANAGTGSFFGAVPRKLPEGYIQTEYIESTGTQYIDTGFKPNQDTRVIVDAELTKVSASAHSAMFGARDANNNQFWWFWWYNASQFAFRYANSTTNTLAGDTALMRHIFDANKNAFSVSGDFATATSASFNCSYTAYLLATNNAGTAEYPSSCKLYACQIYDNGALVRDYVPCINSSGAAGLYDFVNGVFYQNAGTGTFAVGGSVYPIEWEDVGEVIVYDDFTWYDSDIPTPALLVEHMANVAVIRGSLRAVLPEIPADMNDGLTIEEANNIEVVLVTIEQFITNMLATYRHCGVTVSGMGGLFF